MSKTFTITTTDKIKTLRLFSQGTTIEQTKDIVPTCDKIKTSCERSPSKGIANLQSSTSIYNLERKRNKNIDNGCKKLAKAKSNNKVGTRVITENHMQKKSCQGSQPNVNAALESSNSTLRTENLHRESNVTSEQGSKSSSKCPADLKSFEEDLERENHMKSEKGSKSSSKGIAELKSLKEDLERERHMESEKGTTRLSKVISEIKLLIENLERENNMKSGQGSKRLSKGTADLVSSNSILKIENSETECNKKLGKIFLCSEILKSNNNVDKIVVSQTQQCLKPKEELCIYPNQDYIIFNNPVMQYKFNYPMFPSYNNSVENINLGNIALIIYENIPILRYCPFVLEFIDEFYDYDLRRRIFSFNERTSSGERKQSWNEFLRMSSSFMHTKCEIFLNSFRKRLVSLSSSNVSYQYYIVISRESGCNSSSKMYTPALFEEALRDCGIGPLELTYTTLFPSDCRMFVHVPVYVGGYINRMDQKDKPQLNRKTLKQHEVNMASCTQKITKRAPKWYEKCEHNPSEQNSSISK